MIPRDDLIQYIDVLLKEFPTIALLGPRQAGKTTLVRNMGSRVEKKTLYFDLKTIPISPA